MMLSCRLILKFAFVVLLLTAVAVGPVLGTRLDINGPAGSDSFGLQVLALPNGNFVVTDPYYDASSSNRGVGAVYLFSPAGVLISKLTGDGPLDSVGLDVVVLANGNFVVVSPFWGGSVGAVTWVSGTTGLNGVVSETNSLVGSNPLGHPGNSIGDHVFALSNGNYVVLSSSWSNGSVRYAGAITWASGTTGIHGGVSALNSLVGSTANDAVGSQFPVELTNGNYIVASGRWSGVGAVTWFPGGQAKTGILSSANSLVGASSTGNVGLTALPNGHYFVSSPGWRDALQYGLGALTWGDGVNGTVGEISAANSMVGATQDDRVGEGNFIVVGGSNVVLAVPTWDNGSAVDAGAVVWASGTGGTVGRVSASNALVGTHAEDNVGAVGAFALNVLSNGNYIVASPEWDLGTIANAGAVTWGSGTNGVVGMISPSNSLVGSTLNDRVGYVVALKSGNAVISSPDWNNGSTVDAGAVTWIDGSVPTVGVVNPTNSLTGTRSNDRVGELGIEPLSNGHYVILSPGWNSSSAESVGAVTWANGLSAMRGTISTANSLVGTTRFDRVGNEGAIALENGNFLVRSPNWDNGNSVDVGAITWGNGSLGSTGAVSANNSFVGNSTDSPVGNVFPLSTGGYVLVSPQWDGQSANLGAAIRSRGIGSLVGAHTAANSLVGENSEDMLFAEVFDFGGGQFLLRAPHWNTPEAIDAGALRRLSIDLPATGSLCAGQCLLGTGAEDYFGAGDMELYPDRYFVLHSLFFNYNGLMHVGALTFGRLDGIGPLGAVSTLIGNVQFGASNIKFVRIGSTSKFVVSGLAPNQVVLFDASEGQNCTDIDVTGQATATPTEVVIVLANTSSCGAAVEPVVSVKFDFTTRHGSVSPPANCVAAPNRADIEYDCLLSDVLPASNASLRFVISGARSRGFNMSGQISTPSHEANTSNNSFRVSAAHSMQSLQQGAGTGTQDAMARRSVGH